MSTPPPSISFPFPPGSITTTFTERILSMENNNRRKICKNMTIACPKRFSGSVEIKNLEH